MTITLQETALEGLTCLVVDTAHVKLAILPELGAKVVSLVWKASGREFLWRHPGRPFRRAAYAAPYDRYDLSGWDECFPTISEVIYPEEPWKGTLVPDHGELWTLPWQWELQGDTLRMWVQSVRFAYRFERLFRFTAAGSVDITYTVHNPTPFPLKALWSMHPFLQVSPSSRVLLPEGVRVRVELSLHERIGAFLSEHPWPMATDRQGQEVDLSLMGPATQGCMEKLYTTPVPEGWCALYDEADDHYLAFTFDPAQVPYVGICHLRGGWPAEEASYSTILEPCSGWPDRLDLAMTRGASVVIPPQGERQWRVLLQLGIGKERLAGVIGRK